MWFELLCPSVSGIPAKNTDPYSNSFGNVSLASATSPIPSLMSLQAVLKTDPMYEEIVDVFGHCFSRPTSIINHTFKTALFFPKSLGSMFCKGLSMPLGLKINNTFYFLNIFLCLRYYNIIP